MKIIKGISSSMMDDYQLNVTEILLYAAKNFPEQGILYREEAGLARYSYRTVLRRVMRLAKALEKMGVEPGDRIGVLEWNTHRFLELYFGIPAIGAVIVPINPRLHPTEISYIINHSEIKTLFINSDFIRLIQSIENEIDVSRYVVLDLMPKETNKRWLYYEKILEKEGEHFDFPVIDEKAAYSACYTSGTTGRPKGVYYSHRSTVIHSLVWALHLQLSVEDMHLQLTPMYHALGWGLWLSSMIVGAEQILPGRWALKDISPIVDQIIRYNVTISEGVPTIWKAILDELDKRRFSKTLKLRAVLGGSAPSRKLLERLSSYGIKTIHTYGFTEGNPVTYFNIFKPHMKNLLTKEDLFEYQRKQGIPGFLVNSKIINEEGKEITPNTQGIGELVVRGPYIINKYHELPEGEDSFIEIDGVRWFRSGDACTIDRYGYMKIVDRYKDLVKSGGEWISTIDMEDHLCRHPGIEEACVIGIPHPKWGERPIAFIIPKKNKGRDLTEADVYRHLELRFSKWQLPDKIIFVDEIPKTGTGKYMKKALRDKYMSIFNED